MELYETDYSLLLDFIKNYTVSDAVSDDHLVLLNFADDIKYANNIQKDLFEYLLDFYIKIINEVPLNIYAKNLTDIYSYFNSTLFKNKINIIHCIGKEKYDELINVYVNRLFNELSFGADFDSWIPLFNTIVAFGDNLKRVIDKIMKSGNRIKVSFFFYLSVIIFNKKDNLFIEKVEKLYLETSMFEFDDLFGMAFYWNDGVLKEYEETINENLIKTIAKDIVLYFIDEYGEELVELILQEIENATKHTFRKRLAEYLDKMMRTNEKRIDYWYDAYT